MLGKFYSLGFRILKGLEMIFMKLLPGRRADSLKPLVIGNGIAIEGMLLILFEFLLLNLLLRNNLIVRRWLRGRINDRLQILLETIPSFTPVQIAFPNRNPLEGLAALEGGLVAVLLAAHEPSQILEGKGPHEAARPTSTRGSRIATDLYYL